MGARRRDVRYPRAVHVRVSDATADALEAIADRSGRPLATIAREALERGVSATAKAEAGRRGRPVV